MAPRIVSVLVLSIGILGCGTVTPSQEEPRNVEVDFSMGTQRFADASADTVEVESAHEGQLVVAGAMRLPSPCYSVTAEGSALADTVILTLSVTALPRICPMVETTLPYKATIYSLIEHSYTLRVVYTYPETTRQERLFEFQVP